MAYTQAEIQASITALELALARHELTVEYSDRRVTYASTDDILARIRYWRGLLGGATGRPKQTRLVGSKGLSC